MEAGITGAESQKGTVTGTRKTKSTTSKGTRTTIRRGKRGVAYPEPLARYLALAASTTAPAAAPTPKKPVRATYPAVLASVLRLAASTTSPTRSVARRQGKAASKTKSLSRSATKTKTVRRVSPNPKIARYPLVLAQLLEAAKNTANLDMPNPGQMESEVGTKYPDALAAYLDLLDALTVPPSVAPPKRAA